MLDDEKQGNLFDICRNRSGENEFSEAAHDSIREAKSQLQKAVLACIKSAGMIGVNCEQIEQMLGLTHQTASARVSELKRKGLIRVQGHRKTKSGSNAGVLVAV